MNPTDLGEAIRQNLIDLEQLIRQGNTQAEAEFLRIRASVSEIEQSLPCLRFLT